MFDIIMTCSMFCVVSFGAGVLWRNQYNIQQFKTITENHEKVMNAVEESHDTIEQLMKDNDDWRKSYAELSQKVDIFDILLCENEELEKEYQEVKEEIEEAMKTV